MQFYVIYAIIDALHFLRLDDMIKKRTLLNGIILQAKWDRAFNEFAE